MLAGSSFCFINAGFLDIPKAVCIYFLKYVFTVFKYLFLRRMSSNECLYNLQLFQYCEEHTDFNFCGEETNY